MRPQGMRSRRQELADRAAHAVAEVLGTPPGAPRSAHSLFDLPGFDSIAVVAVLERLETDLGVEVPADLIVPEAFDSLDSLTDLLATTVAAATPEAVR